MRSTFNELKTYLRILANSSCADSDTVGGSLIRAKFKSSRNIVPC